jgi:aldose 1-epimerase
MIAIRQLFCRWAPGLMWPGLLAIGINLLAEGGTPMNRVEKDSFGVTADGVAVDRYTLRNAHGMMVRLITYGTTVTELAVPDRSGRCDDVVLGYDHLAPYESPQNPYFGATVGRVAFRIIQGKFALDGKEYQLSINAPPNHLHGGSKGLSRVVWKAEPLAGPPPAVKFTVFSPDGDQGYPGNLQASVTYTLTDHSELVIDYTATCDRPCPVNFTHHSYFNLAGADSGDVLRHVLQLEAPRYAPLDENKLPSGKIVSAAGTAYDFGQPTAIGARIQPQSEVANGYDMCYVMDPAQRGSAPVRMATLSEPTTGRVLEVLSTQPAIVFYTANGLDGTLRGKRGAVYRKHAGVCLETAHLPNSVNRPEFPCTILRPGQTYRQTCIYRFSTR